MFFPIGKKVKLILINPISNDIETYYTEQDIPIEIYKKLKIEDIFKKIDDYNSFCEKLSDKRIDNDIKRKIFKNVSKIKIKEIVFDEKEEKWKLSEEKEIEFKKDLIKRKDAYLNEQGIYITDADFLIVNPELIEKAKKLMLLKSLR